MSTRLLRPPRAQAEMARWIWNPRRGALDEHSRGNLVGSEPDGAVASVAQIAALCQTQDLTQEASAAAQVEDILEVHVQKCNVCRPRRCQHNFFCNAVSGALVIQQTMGPETWFLGERLLTPSVLQNPAQKTTRLPAPEGRWKCDIRDKSCWDLHPGPVVCGRVVASLFGKSSTSSLTSRGNLVR